MRCSCAAVVRFVFAQRVGLEIVNRVQSPSCRHDSCSYHANCMCMPTIPFMCHIGCSSFLRSQLSDAEYATIKSSPRLAQHIVQIACVCIAYNLSLMCKIGCSSLIWALVSIVQVVARCLGSSCHSACTAQWVLTLSPHANGVVRRCRRAATSRRSAIW